MRDPFGRHATDTPVYKQDQCRQQPNLPFLRNVIRIGDGSAGKDHLRHGVINGGRAGDLCQPIRPTGQPWFLPSTLAQVEAILRYIQAARGPYPGGARTAEA